MKAMFRATSDASLGWPASENVPKFTVNITPCIWVELQGTKGPGMVQTHFRPENIGGIKHVLGFTHHMWG